MTKDFMKSAGFQNYELLRDDQVLGSFVFRKTNNIGLQFLASGLSKSGAFMHFSCASPWLLSGYSHWINQKYELVRDHQV